MRLVAERLAEVLVVHPFDFRVMVRAAQLALLVVRVDAARTERTDLVGRSVGLSAATDAAAAAGHHLDEVIGQFFALLTRFANLVDDRLHVAHLVGDGNAYLGSLHIDLCSLDPFHSADGLELDLFKVFLGNKIVGRA